MHYFWSANGPCVQLMSSLKAALRSSIRAVTDQDIVIVKGGPQNLRQLNCSFTTVSSHFFIKTKFRRSFWGAEQVCILIGSWIMTQNANISISGFYRFCKKTRENVVIEFATTKLQFDYHFKPLDWFKNYDTKCKYFHFWYLPIL